MSTIVTITENTYIIVYTNDPVRQRKSAQIKAESNKTARILFIEQATEPDKPIKIISCRKRSNGYDLPRP